MEEKIDLLNPENSPATADKTTKGHQQLSNTTVMIDTCKQK